MWKTSRGPGEIFHLACLISTDVNRYKRSSYKLLSFQFGFGQGGFLRHVSLSSLTEKCNWMVSSQRVRLMESQQTANRQKVKEKLFEPQPWGVCLVADILNPVIHVNPKLKCETTFLTVWAFFFFGLSISKPQQQWSQVELSRDELICASCGEKHLGAKKVCPWKITQ